jgi:hypothetical protein
MTRLDLLRLLIGQARVNGFEFRKWYTGRLGVQWPGTEQATETLATGRYYYALLFSHDFAQTFWKPGEKMTFLVDGQTFQRRGPDGSILTIKRKGYTRRSTRTDSWRYHLKELTTAEDPLRYMRRYLKIVDEVEDDPVPTGIGPPEHS